MLIFQGYLLCFLSLFLTRNTKRSPSYCWLQHDIGQSLPLRSLSALSCCRDACEPVIFLCSLSGGKNRGSKDVFSCFKVCWYRFSQAWKLRELRGTEQLTKQRVGFFFLLYSGGTQYWKGVWLPFIIYLIMAVMLILLALQSMKTCPGLQCWFFSSLSVSVCSLKGLFPFAHAEINLLTAECSQKLFCPSAGMP